MRRALLLLSILACFVPLHASPLHWTTRFLHTECDDHPIASHREPGLMARPSSADAVTPLTFEAERPFTAGATLTLGICHGEVRILPAEAAAGTLKIVVRLGSSLGREHTPTDYLQQFDFHSDGADIEWKLPARAQPQIDIYLPPRANLHLELGHANIEIKGIDGNTYLNLGKGTAKLHAGGSKYREIKVAVAMGSFADLRPGGIEDRHTPLEHNLSGSGPATAEIHVAMGRAEIHPD